MIRITSERITFLSIDIHTRLFFIANATVCTFFLSSQFNIVLSFHFYALSSSLRSSPVLLLATGRPGSCYLLIFHSACLINLIGFYKDLKIQEFYNISRILAD